MNIVAIIGAKGNSTRLQRKNTRQFDKQPLISYTIQHAHQARTVNRVIVSTEDAEIANIAKRYGAEVPFTRPVWLTDNQVSFGRCLGSCVSRNRINEFLSCGLGCWLDSDLSATGERDN